MNVIKVLELTWSSRYVGKVSSLFQIFYLIQSLTFLFRLYSTIAVLHFALGFFGSLFVKMSDNVTTSNNGWKHIKDFKNIEQQFER